MLAACVVGSGISISSSFMSSRWAFKASALGRPAPDVPLSVADAEGHTDPGRELFLDELLLPVIDGDADDLPFDHIINISHQWPKQHKNYLFQAKNMSSCRISRTTCSPKMDRNL